jgi:hypothetical protein
MTPGPYRIVLPGGPQGPFYGLINPQGRVVALQIPSKDDAEFLANAPRMLNLLQRLWNESSALGALSPELLRDFDRFILNESATD